MPVIQGDTPPCIRPWMVHSGNLTTLDSAAEENADHSTRVSF
jgi:hypothetical protein